MQPNRRNDLHAIAAADSRLASAQGDDVRIFCTAFGDFAAQADTAFGSEARGDSLHPQPSPAACKFLSSDWFEELIYVELRQRTPGAEVALDLKVTPAASGTTGNQFAIDVSLLACNQLHIVEAKAQNPDTAAKERRAWVDQTHGYREAIVGPGGYAVLAAASKFDAISETRDWARLRQVRIAAGWEEIVRELDAIAMAARLPAADVVARAS
jgi:hypothetical protein